MSRFAVELGKADDGDVKLLRHLRHGARGFLNTGPVVLPVVFRADDLQVIDDDHLGPFDADGVRAGRS